MGRIDGYLRAIDDDRVGEYWDRQDKIKKYCNKKKVGEEGCKGE